MPENPTVEAQSPRAAAQARITRFLRQLSWKFNATYGVIESTVEFDGGGRTRMIQFGVADFLDATLTLHSISKITIEATGDYAPLVVRRYHSVESVIAALESL